MKKKNIKQELMKKEDQPNLANSGFVLESVRYIRSKTKQHPAIAIILGSGLGDFADSLASAKSIDTSDIPHYPVSTVEGHRGKLIFGKLHTIPVLAFQGRVHYYESGNLESVLYPIRVAHKLGIKTLIVTNAAGGVNRQFGAGDLMLITDQVNLTFENPLPKTERLQQHRQLYDLKLQKIITQTAAKQNIPLKQGVYFGLKGPSYETASEIKMIGQLGGDAVGMSTVNEVSLAVSLGIKVGGISCITNLATGINANALSHAEVTEVANKVKHTFARLLTEVIKALG